MQCSLWLLRLKLPLKKTNTVCSITLLMEKYPIVHLPCICFKGLHGSCWFCMLWGFKRFQHGVVCLCCSITMKKSVGIMLMSSYTLTCTHTLSSWVCRVSLFLPGKGLSENLRGRQEGTRWRPLQIWLLLTVLWSAHVYLLSQHWYLGLCGAWDAGPGLFEVKLIPQTTLLVIAPSPLFSLSFSLFFDPPLPSLLPFFFPIFFLTKMRFGGCRWGAFNVIVCLFTSLLRSGPNKIAKSKIYAVFVSAQRYFFFFLQFWWKNILVINAIVRDFHVRELIGMADTVLILSTLSLSFFLCCRA